MKKVALFLLLSLVFLPLAGCQSTPAANDNKESATSQEDVLSQLPDTKELTFTSEGMEETVSVSKAQRDGIYAMYYDQTCLTYVPGEVVDSAFIDSFISVYDDESTMVPSTMKVCYTPNITPEDWIAGIELGSELAPMADPLSSYIPVWEAADKTATLGEADRTYQLWTGFGAMVINKCYTTPYKDGCLALIVSYPEGEVEEALGSRIQTMATTLVLAAK